jgi:signal transduction histidine kinase
VLILLRDGDELVVAAAAGHVADAQGRRLPISNSASGQLLGHRRPQRIPDVAAHLPIAPEELGVPDAQTALLVPLLNRGASVGVLAAFDHGAEADDFSVQDEQLLRTFAQSAANAVAIKRSVEADRLRSAIDAADSERARWARELHDQTLQTLGGLRVLLASSVGRGDATSKDQAMRQAVQDIELEIANLREVITDLRPSLLDDLGLAAAVEALLDRRSGDTLRIDRELHLGAGRLSLEPGLESTVYRLVQEALTNIVKHSGASTARVAITAGDEEVVVEVQDDGFGFDVDASTEGFGLAGMRERVSLAGGTLLLDSDESGTLVRARLPLRPADPSGGNAVSDRMAS